MTPPEPSAALNDVDRSREQDPQAALELYATIAPSLLAQDEERLVWIFEQIRHSQDKAFLPLVEYAAENTPGLPGRWALHILASAAWYQGDRKTARTHWHAAIEAGRAVKDELWVGCVENLGLVHGAEGHTFESLVLTGMAARVAEDSGFDYSTGYGASRRGWQLTGLGEFKRAESEFERAEAVLGRVGDGPRSDGIAASIAGGRAKLYRAMGEYDLALIEQEKHVALCELLPESQKPVLVGSYCSRIELCYQVFAERRLEILTELEGIPDRYPIGEQWDWAWRNEVLPLRLRYALEEKQDFALALDIGRELLLFLEKHSDDLGIIERASELGRVFAEQLDSPDDSYAAYDVAAKAALRRLLDVNRSAHELPELAEATAEDWEILDAHRKSLLARHAAVFGAIEILWRAGHAASDLLLDEDGYVQACGWCRRIRSKEGHWLPLAQYLPPDDDLSITHGICKSCSAQFEQEIPSAGAGRDSHCTASVDQP